MNQVSAGHCYFQVCAIGHATKPTRRSRPGGEFLGQKLSLVSAINNNKQFQTKLTMSVLVLTGKMQRRQEVHLAASDRRQFLTFDACWNI